MVHSGVGAKVLTPGSQKTARLGRIPTLADEPGIVPVGNKADFHGVRRVGAGKFDVPGNLPHILLLKLSQRQYQPGQNVLGQTVQHIGLVPCGAFRCAQAVETVRALFHPGIVPGGQERTAQLVRFPGQQPELDQGIADNAGVGGASVTVALAERHHNLPLKILLRVNDVQRNAQCFGCGLRLFHCAIVSV